MTFNNWSHVNRMWWLCFWWTRKAKRMKAWCCFDYLSEWFIDRDSVGWGMKCWHCKIVSPFASHADFRESMTPKLLAKGSQ